MNLEEPVFLTVRGKARAETQEAARQLHNQTAGNPQGIAAARALGDLSHNVYVPVAGPQSSASLGELLFHDVWESPKGLMEFFSRPEVHKGGEALFASRDATVWMAAHGAFGFDLPAPARKPDRLVGMVRGPVASADKAVEVFRAVTQKAQRDARRRGQLSHRLYVKLNPPGDRSGLEVLGVDVWCDGAGMAEHYQTMDMGALAPVFSGKVDASVWQAAPGEWAEW